MHTAIRDALASGRWPWYLHGPAGGGKTSAAAVVYRHWPDGWALFWDCGRVCRDLVAARVEGREGPLKNTLRDADLIVLDDIATREPTGPQLDALLAILNWRGAKPLITTGNAAPEELANILHDDRVVSRLCAGVIIEVAGKDRRLQGTLNLKV